MAITQALLDTLAAVDTPTICNALEAIDPAWRTSGFTNTPFAVLDPTLKPIVGVARTATIRARNLADQDEAAGRERRLRWYERIAAQDVPTVAVIEDLDKPAGFGAFWGEVQTHVHRGLGCVGGITNGAIRDLDACAPGFQLIAGSVGPSHAHVHLVEMGPAVTIHGMMVKDGDLVHADRHGAVVVPPHALAALPATIAHQARKEKVILDAAKAPGFDLVKLRDAMLKAAHTD